MATSTNECQVAFCRFKHCHTTIGHKCGSCGQYGHGQTECGNQEAIDSLRQYYDDKLDRKDWCLFTSCKHPWSHTTLGHHCHLCNGTHSSSDCLIKPLEWSLINYPCTMRQLDDTSKFDHRTFIEDCKRSHPFDNLYYKIPNFYENDDYVHNEQIETGKSVNNYMYVIIPYNKDPYTIRLTRSIFQYCNSIIDNIYLLIKKVESQVTYTNVTNKYNEISKLDEDKVILECPICRTEIKENQVFNLRGLEDECKVCLSGNKVTKAFSCSHACVCDTCFDNLKQNFSSN